MGAQDGDEATQGDYNHLLATAMRLGRRVMKMEWLRAGDSTPACWACFMIFDNYAEVLAVIGANERIDGQMTLAAARKLWSDLKQRGWYRATNEEINHHQMSHRALRRIAYGRA